mmetsp:Transcript_61629/g.155629  ORF Transcript_61629/g.155629 Transcript_61629/m.155629 type:complete len:222 (+) Transcript_61629:691-1356(+)
MLRREATQLLLVVEPHLSLKFANKTHEHKHHRSPQADMYCVSRFPFELLRAVDGHEDVARLNTGLGSLSTLRHRSDHNPSGAPSSEKQVFPRLVTDLVNDQPASGACLLLPRIPLLLLGLQLGLLSLRLGIAIAVTDATIVGSNARGGCELRHLLPVAHPATPGAIPRRRWWQHRRLRCCGSGSRGRRRSRQLCTAGATGSVGDGGGCCRGTSGCCGTDQG